MRAIAASIEAREVTTPQPPKWYLSGLDEFYKWLHGWESGTIPWPTEEDYKTIRLWEKNRSRE